MKNFLLLATFTLISCTTSKDFFSSPQDSSRITDPKYTQSHITSKIEFNELDQNLSRFYSSPNSPHVAVIPLTGALIDSIGFLKSENDNYDKYEYRKLADQYKAYFFNKTSCFYIFLKNGNSLNDYDITSWNNGDAEQKVIIKSEAEYDSMLKILNEVFSKTYTPGTPRSVETSSVFEQDLVCGNKIDFNKPFSLKFKSNNNDKTSIELHWL